MGPKKKEDLRVKRTRMLLSQALLSLMNHHSFHAISVKEICEEAMVHRATFYTHFNDKYDLLAYSLKQIAEEFHFSEGSTEEVHLKLFAVAIKYKRLFSQLLQEERDSLRYVIKQEMTLGITQRLRTESKTQTISSSSEIVMAAFAGATLGVVHWWIENEMPLTGEEVYHELKKVFDWKHVEEAIGKE
ncbi:MULTISPECIES: TetR/AcrR family transcriptional regulator [Paenibacillus]|uniref:TetR/AcrR family transcriptional regulator n=1 Tax=Paenibacillus TaxID=44249 RepID=UPI0022B92400|nr:TetR/AcrR family transcriptional regulator [Paenibacillus caseinilyticus]MCZ8521353.1 TetR/AcrR family transcriptional regulator [Paenibacillus caseinilyticus]